MNALLESAISKLKEKGEALGIALTLEQSLEDDRAAVKADAIKRIMTRDGCAATPAEKVVETDAGYFAHRAEQRASIVARFRADAEYWAAKAEATQASLITPTMIDLEFENGHLRADRAALVRSLDDAREGIKGWQAVATEENEARHALAKQLAIEIATRLTPASAESVP